MSTQDPRVGPQRFKQIPPDQHTPEQRTLADGVRSGPRSAIKNFSAAHAGPLGGPFNVWLRTPDIGNLIQQLGAAIRFRSSIPAKLNELAICITARKWTAQYEWHAHRKLAVDAGLDPAIADDIAQGRKPARMDQDEQLVYDVSTELHATGGLADATYKRALDRFGEQGVVDLIAVNGYYTLVSFTLNTDRTPLPAGVPLPLPDLKQ